MCVEKRKSQQDKKQQLSLKLFVLLADFGLG